MAREEELIIRARRDDDGPGAVAALVAVHASDGYPVEGVAEPERWLSPPGLLRAWVAELAGEVVGHVAVGRPDGEDAAALWIDGRPSREVGIGVLARLFVLPRARKRSAGELLVRAAEDYASRNGLRLVLDVMVKDAPAMRLYERLGWREIGRTTHRFGPGRRVEAVCYVSPGPTPRPAQGEDVAGVPRDLP
jgi:ribosomal protein S18 acetylase RimI-like enzyme